MKLYNYISLLAILVIALFTVSPAQIDSTSLGGWKVTASSGTITSATQWISDTTYQAFKTHEFYMNSDSSTAWIEYERTYNTLQLVPPKYDVIAWNLHIPSVDIYIEFRHGDSTQSVKGGVGPSPMRGHFDRYGNTIFGSGPHLFNTIRFHFNYTFGSGPAPSHILLAAIRGIYAPGDTVAFDNFNAPPVFSVDSTSVHINTLVGVAQSHMVTVSNIGEGDLVIDSVTIDNPKFTVTPTSFPAIPAANMTDFTVSYTPTMVETVNANLVFYHNADGSPNTVLVTGTSYVPDSAVAIHIGEVGWNLFSMPVTPADGSFVPPMGFAYEGLYVRYYTFTNGLGYWAKVATNGFTVVGTPVTSVSINLRPAWNMIGALGTATSTVSANVVPSNILASNYFGYSAALGYFVADSFMPGYGYWVKTISSGQMTIDAQGNVPSNIGKASPLHGLNKLVVRDAQGRAQTLYFGSKPPATPLDWFTLPPTLPEGALNVRFTEGRMAAVVPAELSVSNAQYPLTLEWNVTDGQAYRLGTQNISGTGKVQFTSSAARFALTPASTPAVPAAFALEQNYPNPFNPTTVIDYRVQSTELVMLKVYNVLGQEVATLANEVQTTGEHSVTFDATKFPSGMYFYKLQAGAHQATKKMMVIK